MLEVASLGIFDSIVLIEVSIVLILSYTAFLDGAIAVTPFHPLQYAASDTAPAVASATWSSTYFFTV